MPARPHRPIEIIIVDDGSEDDTARTAADFGPPVKLLQQPGKLAAQLACFREDAGTGAP